MIAFHSSQVLAPTDLSDQAERAVEMALGMVDRPEQLTVLYVAPPSSSFAFGDPALVWQEISEEERAEELRQMLRTRHSNVRFEGVNFEVRFGAPADEIAQYAALNETELIVLPSHGRNGLVRLMIGSVAERVVRLAHCPVLVLRE